MSKKILKSVTFYSCLPNYDKKVNLADGDDIARITKSIGSYSWSLDKSKLPVLAQRVASDKGDAFEITIKHLGSWKREIKFDTKSS